MIDTADRLLEQLLARLPAGSRVTIQLFRSDDQLPHYSRTKKSDAAIAADIRAQRRALGRDVNDDLSSSHERNRGPVRRAGNHGKLCGRPGCGLRVGPRTKVCLCGYVFEPRPLRGPDPNREIIEPDSRAVNGDRDFLGPSS